MRSSLCSRLIPVLLLSLLLPSVGCTRQWLELPSAPSSVMPASLHAARPQPGLPVALAMLSRTQNGAPHAPGTDLAHHVLAQLQDTHLFSTVLPFGSDVTPFWPTLVLARLHIEDRLDSHSGAAAWKGFVIGASMFLLEPVLPLHYDYTTQLTLDLEQEDGTLTSYRAHATGTAHYPLFATDPLLIDSLKDHVLHAGLADLMAQLRHDAARYVQAPTPTSPLIVRSHSTARP